MVDISKTPVSFFNTWITLISIVDNHCCCCFVLFCFFLFFVFVFLFLFFFCFCFVFFFVLFCFLRLPLGGTQFFFGGCVPHGFQKVGSREWIFLEKLGVFGTKMWKICILRAEILSKTRLKMQNLSKN